MAGAEHLQWRRSRRCDSGACVEVAMSDDCGEIAIRDSKDPDGACLIFAAEEWMSFVTRLRRDAA
jgi:hypothetical protein